MPTLSPHIASTEPPERFSAGTLHKMTFPAMGTTCEIQYVTSTPAHRIDFEHAAVAWVDRFEAKFSRFKPTSLISQINAAAGRDWVPVDEEMELLCHLCDGIYAMTHGVLDPTILPLVRLWNWKAENPRIPTADQIEQARRAVGWEKVERADRMIHLPLPGMALDFGGFGKEYAVDVVARIARDHGLTDVLVDFGHDILASGAPPGRRAWHIGLEDPERPGSLAGSITLTGKGVASSGDYVRRFEVGGRRYGHIIDPRTGWPVSHGCTQTTVIADSCLQAGILSTTAFVLGLTGGIEYLRGFPGAEGLIRAGTSRGQTHGFYRYEMR